MQLTEYFFQHVIGLRQRIVIPEADYPKALRFKTSCSFAIADGLLEMLSAIQFHYQLLF